jgi:hypothetical protein
LVTGRSGEPAPDGADAGGTNTVDESGESRETVDPSPRPAASGAAKPRSPLRPAGRHHAA